MSKYAREVSQAIRDYFGKKQEKKQYLVKGRGVGGLVLWDVFELDGFSQPQLAGTDFQFQEEAIAFARDRSLGRMSVGYGKIRGMFKAGKGGVIVPGKGIDTPGQGHVNVVHTRQGIVVG